MLDYQFKLGADESRNASEADVALAFAMAGAMRRFGLAAHVHVTADGEQVTGVVQHATARELLRRLGTDVSRYRPLRGLNIEREARLQQERLLNEDIESALGWAPYTARCMSHRHAVDVADGRPQWTPSRSVNHQPAGFDKLDAAFEATFGC